MFAITHGVRLATLIAGTALVIGGSARAQRAHEHDHARQHTHRHGQPQGHEHSHGTQDGGRDLHAQIARELHILQEHLARLQKLLNQAMHGSHQGHKTPAEHRAHRHEASKTHGDDVRKLHEHLMKLHEAHGADVKKLHEHLQKLHQHDDGKQQGHDAHEKADKKPSRRARRSRRVHI